LSKRWLWLLVPVLVAASFPWVQTRRVLMGEWELRSESNLMMLMRNADLIWYCLDRECVFDRIEGPMYGRYQTPAQITASQDNYAPTDCAEDSIYRLSSDAAWSITGIDSTTCQGSTASAASSKLLTLLNVGSFPITLETQDLGSQPENRFNLGADYALAPGTAVGLQYDAPNLRWVARHPLGGGGGLSDADYGDVVVSGAGTAMDLDEADVEVELEGALELNDLQGTLDTANLTDDPILEGELASLGDLNTQLTTTIADGPHTTDTNAGTICNGTTTYLDGEGTCDDLTTVYQPASSELNNLINNCDIGNDSTPIPDSCVGDGSDAGAGSALDAWPVGSVFITVSATAPATLLGGGTWEAIGTGRVLVGLDSGDTDFDTVEETGGAKTQTIGASNLPQLSVAITDPGHVHDENAPTSASSGAVRFATDTNASGTVDSTLDTASATTGITATANTGGANNPLSIVQPYLVVYMYKRTA
jgi:hypothetical protein